MRHLDVLRKKTANTDEDNKMIGNNLCKAGLGALAMTAAIGFAPASSAALTTYSADFETPAFPVAGSTDPIGDWLIGLNRLNPDKTYNSTYFGGAATAEGSNVVGLTTGEGGAAQGDQQVNMFSDYNNQADQTNGNWIESNFFREETVTAAQAAAGDTWKFTFDAKEGNIVAGVDATAFIKIFAPGFAFVDIFTFDTSKGQLSDTWSTGEVSVNIQSGWENYIIQYGFQTIVQNNLGSANFYDNVCFDTGTGCPLPSEIPVPAAVWLFGSGLLGLVGVARRRKG